MRMQDSLARKRLFHTARGLHMYPIITQCRYFLKAEVKFTCQSRVSESSSNSV